MKATKAKRALLIGISCLFILILLFSHLLILAEADHDCAGEGCRICEMIAAAEETLRAVSLLICAAAISVPTLAAAKSLRSATDTESPRFTPVLLKVKLTN